MKILSATIPYSRNICSTVIGRELPTFWVDFIKTLSKFLNDLVSIEICTLLNRIV